MANPSAQEQKVSVSFYSEAVHLTHESEKQGRPVFQDFPHVRIIIPGDKNTVIERKATAEDKQAYPYAWSRFEQGDNAGSIGTPLEQWPQITRSQLKEAVYFEVKTVEQLAMISDEHITKLGMGFRSLRQSAKDYLDAAKIGAAESALAAKNARQADEMAAMQAQINQLAEALAKAQEAPEKEEKKLGRPRKEE
jgi:hypothetical protein